MATVGKNILDNLTTGMYSDSKVIYREYIQNACDQIDLAMKLGILGADEGSVDIFIDPKNRYISIKDNATGVKHNVFATDLGDIANSNKEIGKNKGFRGIGRLCGLAYCKTLKFTTSYNGEAVKSTMVCDAQTMRKMLYENKKYTLDEIWDSIVSFEEEPEKADEHYFEVEMFDINQENTDLLDKTLVCKYLRQHRAIASASLSRLFAPLSQFRKWEIHTVFLHFRNFELEQKSCLRLLAELCGAALSFVAPVPYNAKFILGQQIYDHAAALNYHIDEYCVRINGAEIFKEYSTRLREPSGSSQKTYDEISTLRFKDFVNDGKLIAWMWVGISRFEKQIPKINQMRGIRLRSANIQIGGDDALQELFKESRGNYYYVGEVFAVDDGLIPNSQRDYFNENGMRLIFEEMLSDYFSKELHSIYYTANKIKNAFKRQEDYLGKVQEYSTKSKNHGFIDEDDKQKLQFAIEKAKGEATEARKTLDKFKDLSDTPIAEVYKNIDKKYNAEQLTQKASTAKVPDPEKEDNGQKYVSSGMSKLSRSERKLVTKILAIITSNAPKDIAETIIEKIKEEMR